MSMEKIYLKDYEKSAYELKFIDLVFDLDDTKTLVKSKMQMQKASKSNVPLVLDGEDIELLHVEIDSRVLHESEYEKTDTSLTLHNLPETFTLEIHNLINPQENTALDGLYKSSGIFCTQNEPEGFRRITYFLDRPDVMAIYSTKVIADKKKYPVLLSNGNLFEKGNLEDGKHYAIWKDPFPKPSYLYALVAGDLGVVNDSFKTMSDRDIELNIYCDKGNEDKCSFAMESLKNSMTWDEEKFGREYDLDIYNIVAVDSFNMGAMENKGLNVFNSHYVLADADTATDANFMGIESVIGHEYFHNWTGNRITCRDWFQLTLKEGLTVFRDQEFSSDLNSRPVQRIADVKALRERQFVEDAGPTSHPIKPESYIQINNFYTATIYEKGAEVIRMIHTLIGAENFRKAMDLYFDTFDGQAVRTEDFLWAMQEASGFDLEQFKLWYSQSGTPELDISSVFKKNSNTLEIKIKQSVLSPVQAGQKPYFFPFKISLLANDGQEVSLKLQDTSSQALLKDNILIISKESETFIFEDIQEKVIVSFNQNFSAPVKVHTAYSLSEYAFLMSYDKDEFNRFEASQTLASKVLHKLIDAVEQDKAMSLNPIFIEAFSNVLKDMDLDMSLKADMLNLPSVSMLMQDREVLDVEAIYIAINFVKRELVRELGADIKIQYLSLLDNKKYELKDASKRKLKNTLLAYLGALKDDALAASQYKNSNNMTDRFSALTILANSRGEAKKEALKDFYERYRENTLVMNKYLAVVASSELKETYSNVQALLSDEVFDIKVPNLVRALIGSFARNALHFHSSDGKGYKFIADKVIELDKLNPQIASGLSGVFKDYKKLNENAKALMKVELEKIVNTKDLSKNVYEIVSKILS